jgi:hypothetical protein
MRTTIAIALGLVLGSGVASAQAPGSDEDAPPMTQPSSDGPPGSFAPAPEAPFHQYVPPAYNYQRTVVITAEEANLLNEGEMPVGRYVAGGITAVAAGFGIGHIVQGRWLEKGWIFTFGEGAAIAAMMAGVAQSIDSCYGAYNDYNQPCQNSRHRGDGVGLVMGGLLAFTGLHIWEVVDAWVAPPHHNRQIRELRGRLGETPMFSSAAPYIAPVHGTTSGGGVAGVALQF